MPVQSLRSQPEQIQIPTEANEGIEAPVAGARRLRAFTPLHRPDQMVSLSVFGNVWIGAR
jgi:hypothetical protein